MKKIFSLLSFVALSVFVQAQSGDGSAGNPFYGTITTSVHWTVTNPGSTVYLGTPANNDLTIDNNGHLTIDPGITVIFTQLTSDLVITGTGILTANGNNSNRIIFTKASDKSHWGHISFRSMGSASASIIDYCIIEYGDVSSTALIPPNPNQYGGAIHTDFSNLTISNCEIRNNKAGWGGGIFVGNGKNPSISNCYIHNNTSTTAGGGIYFWTDSYSIVTNCLVTFNGSTGTGGGGGIFLGGLAKNVTIINSVISSNTANNQSIGYNIRFNNNTNTPKPIFINSIIWYPANSIVYLNGGSALAADFEYCAIQSPPRTYTNCITLNASNIAPDGPNFIATDGSDWSISPVSPCRNAGTNSYGSPNSIPENDYAGRLRIVPFDIGAYEAYNRWIGGTAGHETDWSYTTNWASALVPTITSDVAIPDVTNDPLITSDVTVASLVTDPGSSLTVGTNNLLTAATLTNGGNVILQPNAKGTLSTIINTGSLKLNSGPAGTASLITDSYTRGTGGSEEIQLYLSGGGNALDDNFKWHFISTPVSSLDVSTFAPGATYNVAQWIESRPTGSLFEGWVAYDGYIYPSGTMGGETFSSLTPGKGYDFFDETDNTFTFGGNFNTADVTMNLGYSGTPSIHGFNLLGNPFSSGLDWDYIITHSYPASTSKSLYFTRDNVQCTYASGVGIPSDVNGIIPPMQGFFNKTYSTGNSITFPAAARTHDNIHNRYKGASIIPLVRLSITDNSMTDETVVRFDNEAKADLDYDFDAVKMSVASSKTYLYTLVFDIKYAINGQPFPEDTIKIPVVVNVTAEGTHTISASQLQGLDKYNVSLLDKSNSISIDLKKTPQFTFTSSPGTLTDRFVLNISKIATGIEIPVYQENKLNIYHSLGFVNIQTLSDELTGKTCSVRILDLTGKTVKDVRNLELDNNSLIRISSSGLKGIYFVEVKAGALRYVGKVVIR